MLLWSLVGVPLLAGAGLGLAGRRADRAASGFGLLVAAAVLGLAIAAALARPAVQVPLLAGSPAGLAVDGLSALMVVTVAAATLAVLAAAAGDPTLRTGRFVGLVLGFAAAMLVTVTATSLAPLLMAWEVMGATSWALIGYHWRDTAAVRAGHVAFLTTRTADLGLYLAAGAALAGGVGSLALADLPGAATPALHVVAAGVVLAALGKSAQLPFSFWLARAMAGPSPVSALLHSATMVAAGAYLLLRLAPLLQAAGWAAPLVAWVGAGTALLLGVVAVAQSDLKQLLAASTSAQIGFMVLAAGVGGSAAGALHLVAHAATKSMLFLGAGAWLLALGARRLVELRGAARRFPLVGVTFTVGALALAGLPPLSLWATKDAVLAAALQRSTGLHAVGLAAAAVSAVYATKALWWVWRPAPEPDERPVRPPGAGGSAARATRLAGGGALVGLAAAAAVLGVPVLAGAVPVPAGWELALSGAVAAGAAALTWWRGGDRLPQPAPLRDRLGLERAARVAVVGPVLALARRLDGLDRRLDGLVTAVPSAVGRLATGLARLDDSATAEPAEPGRRAPSLAGAVRAVTAGAAALGRLARRPQTGQIHQYYAQSAAVLAALVLLVLVVR